MFRKLQTFNITPVSVGNSDAIREVLSDYEQLAGSDPHVLRESIPCDEMWRFFVDGIRQQDGWLPFEKNEPGYFKAMFKAFQEIFDFTTPVEVGFIKKLHRIALDGVENTNYEDDYINGPGEFRADDHRRGGTCICSSNVTLDGLYDALDDPSHAFLQFSIEYFDFNYRRKVIDINNTTLKLLRSKREEFSDSKQITSVELSGIINQFCEEGYLAYLKWEKELAFEIFACLSRTDNHRDTATGIYGLIASDKFWRENYSFLLRSIQVNGNSASLLNEELKKIINTFNRSIMNKANPDLKLSAIIGFVQACEQLHPFSDANCRVFCMLLLNHLCMRHGFPPVILDDPNRFDGYSKSELMVEVIKGMQNTLALATHAPLYGYHTESCVATLMQKNKTDDLLHFEYLRTTEAENRRSHQENINNGCII